jgi:DNA-binding NtrC family response regulator
MQRLKTWSWPGHVRELRNFVEATLSTGEPPELHAPDAVPAGARLEIGRFEAMPYKDARAALLEEFEKHYVTRLLERSERNVALAARTAALDRSYLHELIRKHRLK